MCCLPTSMWNLFLHSPREQLDHMTDILTERTRILKELIPFDDINYGIDEQWARIYPYGQKASPGGSLEYSVKIFNHSGVAKTFFLEQEKAEGFKVEPEKASIVIGPQSEGEQKFKVSVSGEVASGISLCCLSM